MAYRIQADSEYIQKLGRAVYNFSYYESVVLQSMEEVHPGYRSEHYLAKKPYTSGKVAGDFKKKVSTYPQSDTAAQDQLAACAQEFYNLIKKRNPLIHGHPYTAAEGFQQLGYSHSGKPRIEWPLQDVEAAAQEFDDAACRLCELFDQLWR